MAVKRLAMIFIVRGCGYWLLMPTMKPVIKIATSKTMLLFHPIEYH